MVADGRVIDQGFRNCDEGKPVYGSVQFPSSSNREELGALELAPARSRERQRGGAWPGTSQAIGKRLSGRLNDTSVAPEFTPKRNSELSDNRDRRPHDAVRLEIGEERVADQERTDTCFCAGAGVGADGAGMRSAPARRRRRRNRCLLRGMTVAMESSP